MLTVLCKKLHGAPAVATGPDSRRCCSFSLGAVKLALMVHLQGQVEHLHSQLAPPGPGEAGVPAALRRLVRKYAGEEATEQLLGPPPLERRRPSLRGADGGCCWAGVACWGPPNRCKTPQQRLPPAETTTPASAPLIEGQLLLGSCAGCQDAGEQAVYSS